MKKMIFLLICVLSIYSQITAQVLLNGYNKETAKVCNKIKNSQTSEASKLLSNIEKPVLSDKSQRLYISYNYLKFFLLKSYKFSQAEAKHAFDTISLISNLFKTMPQKAFLKRNTKNKLLKDCPLVDINGNCFTKLEKFWSDTLVQFKNELNNLLTQSKIDSVEKKYLAIQDSLLSNKDSIVKVVNQTKKEVDQGKILLASSIEKQTIKAANTDLKTKKSKAAKDSVFIGVTVTNFDSIRLDVYLISEDKSDSNGIYIVNEYGVAQYCNQKVNSIIENAVFDITRRWFSILKGDSLNISVKIAGEADDTWFDKNQLQNFQNDSYGIGSKLGLKTGDKITNNTIAQLRTLSAAYFFESGIRKTESFLEKNLKKKNVIVVANSYHTFSQDWMKVDGEQIGPEYRRETIILKCNNCK